MVFLYSMTISGRGPVDSLDAALIELLAAEPRVGALEASKRLRVARGTVQARLERLSGRGVITGYGPEVDPAALGYEVTAFVTLEIRQAGGHDPVAERLAAIPEVLEAHTITGAGDMLCRVVARSNADLQRVIDAIVSTAGVVRSATLISLATQIPYRILPLVRAAAGAVQPGGLGGPYRDTEHAQAVRGRADDGPELRMAPREGHEPVVRPDVVHHHDRPR
jgi:DNA-binding Lrp family transcriptional regulator